MNPPQQAVRNHDQRTRSDRDGTAPGPLVADALSASYGKADPVFQDVSFTVQPGRMLAVTGASGAGKSTLLWLLAGAKPPRDGQVRVGGDRIGDHGAAIGSGIALMPQGNGLATILTAAENIQVALLAAGTTADDATAITAQSLSAVGLEDSADHLIEELSGGQQQRVAFARLLAGHSAYLLADEPTSDLDATNRALVMDLLRARADEGAVVIVTTHDPEAAAVADGELHLDDGSARWVRPLD